MWTRWLWENSPEDVYWSACPFGESVPNIAPMNSWSGHVCSKALYCCATWVFLRGRESWFSSWQIKIKIETGNIVLQPAWWSKNSLLSCFLPFWVLTHRKNGGTLLEKYYWPNLNLKIKNQNLNKVVIVYIYLFYFMPVCVFVFLYVHAPPVCLLL